MVEAVFLHRPVVRDPGSLVFELMRAEAAIPHPSNFLGDDKARVLEDSYVLLDARKGHIEARGQIADRRIRPPKTPAAQFLHIVSRYSPDDRTRPGFAMTRKLIMWNLVSLVGRVHRWPDA